MLVNPANTGHASDKAIFDRVLPDLPGFQISISVVLSNVFSPVAGEKNILPGNFAVTWKRCVIPWQGRFRVSNVRRGLQCCIILTIFGRDALSTCTNYVLPRTIRYSRGLRFTRNLI